MNFVRIVLNTLSLVFLLCTSGLCPEPGGKPNCTRTKYSGPYRLGSQVIYTCGIDLVETFSKTSTCQNEGERVEREGIVTSAVETSGTPGTDTIIFNKYQSLMFTWKETLSAKMQALLISGGVAQPDVHETLSEDGANVTQHMAVSIPGVPSAMQSDENRTRGPTAKWLVARTSQFKAKDDSTEKSSGGSEKGQKNILFFLHLTYSELSFTDDVFYFVFEANVNMSLVSSLLSEPLLLQACSFSLTLLDTLKPKSKSAQFEYLFRRVHTCLDGTWITLLLYLHCCVQEKVGVH